MRNRWVSITLTIFFLWLIPDVAYADNCGSLGDCFGTLRAAVAATVGLAIFGTILSVGLDFIPVVGTAKGLIEAITGKDLVTGEELALWERALGVIPFAGAATDVLKAGKLADELFDLNKGLHSIDSMVSLGKHSEEAAVGLIKDAPKGFSRSESEIMKGTETKPASLGTKVEEVESNASRPSHSHNGEDVNEAPTSKPNEVVPTKPVSYRLIDEEGNEIAHHTVKYSSDQLGQSFEKSLDLNKYGKSLDEIKELYTKPIHELSDEDIRLIKQVRLDVPPIERNTVIQKVLPYNLEEGMFEAVKRPISGYVARADDAGQLNTFDELYRKLKLDYGDSSWNKHMEAKENGIEKCLVVRFSADEPSLYRVPFGGSDLESMKRVFDGDYAVFKNRSTGEIQVHAKDEISNMNMNDIKDYAYKGELEWNGKKLSLEEAKSLSEDQLIEAYSKEIPTLQDPPFTGRGFTETNETLMPEYRMDDRPYNDGDELYEVTKNGEKLIGVFDTESNKFLKTAP